MGLAGSVVSVVSAKGISGAGVAKGAAMAAKVKARMIGVAAVLVIVGSAGTAMYLSKGTAGRPASAPAATGPSLDYLDAYALPPGRVIANFPDVGQAVREAALRARTGGKLVRKPGFMVWGWTGNKLSSASVWGPPVGAVPLDRILDIYDAEVGSALRAPEFQGDIVFRVGATEEEYLASLSAMVSERLHHPVKCASHPQLMDVVVLSGSYHFSAVSLDVAGDHPALSIALYVNRIEEANYESGSARQFAGTVGKEIGMPVVIDCPDFPKHVGWASSQDCLNLVDPADVEALLRHVTEGSGLAVSREKRSIRCLFVENAQDHLPVAAWQDERRVSPFEEVRWKAELPEVEVEGTWYGLAGVGRYSVERLVGFAKESEPGDWKKRFEEDFVVMLRLMGVDDVTERGVAPLWLKDLQTGKVRMREAVMTEENRQEILKTRQSGG